MNDKSIREFFLKKMNLLQCNEDLVSTAVAEKQGQLLQEASVCGKPEMDIISKLAADHDIHEVGNNKRIYLQLCH